MIKIFAVCLLLVAVQAIEPYGHHEYQHGQGGYHHEEEQYYTEPHYSFMYEVNDQHTHDIKSHKEERKGDHTQGVYQLIEPDGSKRIVEYHVEGKSGFNAVVHKEPSKHPSNSAAKGGYDSAAAYHGYASGGALSAGYSSGHGATSYSSLSTKGSLGAHSSGYAGAQMSGLKFVQPHVFHSSGYSNLGAGEHNQAGGYKSSYSSLSSGGYSSGGYGAGDATSSVKINTDGAHISSITHHVVPHKHHY